MKEIRLEHGPDNELNPSGYVIVTALPDFRMVCVRDHKKTGEVRDTNYFTWDEFKRYGEVAKELRTLSELDNQV